MRLLTVKEAGVILSFKSKKILDLIHLGDLEAYKFGNRFRISEGDLRRFIEKSRIKSIWK
jgi:excisionase family DNA binding protein